MADPEAAWAALSARGLLIEDLSAASFECLYRYATGLAAAGTVADPWDALCPGVVRTDPGTARRLATAAPAPVGARAGDRPVGVRPSADDVLAPLLAGYARWAWAGLRHQAGPHPMYGLMRDGGVLADALAAACPGATGRRLWLSRRLCLVAALRSPDDRDGLINLLVRARGHPPCLAEAAEELGVADERPPTGLDGAAGLTPDRLPRVLDWLATGRRRSGVEARIQAVRQGIVRHLRAAGALDGPVLPLLDVGYAATIQTALARLLAAEDIVLPLWGAYLVTTPGAVWAHRVGGAARGFLADFGAPVAFAEAFLRCREVIETMFASGDGPLTGHGPDGEPLVGPPTLPPTQKAEVAAEQRAALATIAAMPPGTEPSAATARALCLRLLTTPTIIEAIRIGNRIYDDRSAVGPPRRLAAIAGDTIDPADLHGASRDLVLWPAAALLRAGQA